jgi:hypothetical protein
MTDYIAKLSRSFVSRAKSQNMKGVARDRAALEFFCGAIAAIELTGDKAGADRVATFAAMLIQVRGYAALIAAIEASERGVTDTAGA